MRFATFTRDGREGVGLVLDEAIFDLTAFFAQEKPKDPTRPLAVATMRDVIAHADVVLAIVDAILPEVRSRYAQWLLPMASIGLLAPIGRMSRNVFCVGRNYIEHVAEGDLAQGRAFERPVAPQFFTKPPGTIVGPGDAVPFHEGVTAQLDYEVELAVIIGKGGCNISRVDAFDHIFGYAIINDITARDLQRRHGQWFKGKGLDGSCPFGPWIVHKSAWSHRDPHGIRLSVNGELRQQNEVTQMIFPVEEVIETLSAGLTLEPGDVIATGTPSGVGYARTPPVFLQDGDVVVAEIDGLGSLVNTIRRVPAVYRPAAHRLAG